MTGLRCPRCESIDLEPCSEMLYASDELVQSTHECTKCHTRFRRTEADAWRPEYQHLPAAKET